MKTRQTVLSAFYADVTLPLPLYANTNLCADFGSGTLGSNPTVQDCNNAAIQTIYRVPATLSLSPVNSPNLCLEIIDAVPSVGTPLLYRSCNAGPGQKRAVGSLSADSAPFPLAFGNRRMGAPAGYSAGNFLALQACAIDSTQMA